MESTSSYRLPLVKTSMKVHFQNILSGGTMRFVLKLMKEN